MTSAEIATCTETHERYVREWLEQQTVAGILKELGTEWLPSLPDIHARLLVDPPARIADIGCGGGWSSIAMAQAYPKVSVDGYDLDEPSVEDAQVNVENAGIGDRVKIFRRDAGDPALKGRYDLVTAFECIHDMSDPVAALRAMLGLAGDSGTVIIIDERVGDTFTARRPHIEMAI